MLTRKYSEFARLGPQMQMGFLCRGGSSAQTFWGVPGRIQTISHRLPVPSKRSRVPVGPTWDLDSFIFIGASITPGTPLRNTPTIQLSTLDDTYYSRGHQENRRYSNDPHTAEMSPTVKIGSSGQWRQVVSSSSIVIADCEFPPCLEPV